MIAACDEAIGGLDGTDRALALFNRGRARQVLGDKAGGESDLRQSAAEYTAGMSTSKPQAARLYGRANAWHALREFDKALADYNNAARLDPLEPLIFLNRGILLAHEKKDRYLALIDFETVLALEPNNARVLRRAEQEWAALMLVSESVPVATRQGPALEER